MAPDKPQELQKIIANEASYRMASSTIPGEPDKLVPVFTLRWPSLDIPAMEEQLPPIEARAPNEKARPGRFVKPSRLKGVEKKNLRPWYLQ